MGAKTSQNLELAFDVGHSSIGWAVLEGDKPVQIKGCGAVIFRADDCLASSRRAYRRQRRHIRSTRQRIARLKIVLKGLGALTETELNSVVSSAPWQLAGRVLKGGQLLSWPELWDVLRWYAHNRGYDGNRRWSAVEADAQKEDSEKEENARSLMGKHGARSMAETFCKELGIDPLGNKSSSMKRFKGLNAAFPRDVVEREVGQILQAHFGKLKGVDSNLEKSLLCDWTAIPSPDLKLPKRYKGGLLFGQLVPRFENRIISTCPIAGEKHKVPSRNCPEFLNFRWAMQLANIMVGKSSDRDLRPLTASERKTLDGKMRERGYLTPKELKDAVREIAACERSNLDTMFMHPDAKEALLVNPVQKLVTSDELEPFWNVLPARLQKRLRGQWRRGKVYSLSQIREQLKPLGGTEAFDAKITKRIDSHNSKAKKKENQITQGEVEDLQFPSKRLKLDGRAAYSRPLLIQAFEEVLAGKHPKEAGGCLFITEEMREAQLQRAIDDQTNNHLVRHRLLILKRLLTDIIKEFAGGDKAPVAKMTIEVNRDLREMSGMTAKAKAQYLGQRLANHRNVAEKLEEALRGKQINGRPIEITASLIRKGRVAEDLSWTCPYTGQQFEPIDLVTRYVDKDHIIPRSQRPTDGLDSLVITFSEINKWKGNRTALQFVNEEQGKPVPGLPNLSIFSLSRYKSFVEGLESFRGHGDDKRRKKKRKELMLLAKYEEREFTPRDLTQTSQLARLGAQALKAAFSDCERMPVAVSQPGSVTGAVRKAWKVLGCLGLANSEVLDENGEVKTKTEIRDITHLHHALDACVLGLTSHFIPNDGGVWELIVKRNPNEAEKRRLAKLDVFGFNAEGRFEMRDLDGTLKEQIRQRLAEKRVVQHIPARMDGLRVEENTWGIAQERPDGIVLLRQRIRQANGSRTKKEVPEKTAKLLGLTPLNGIGKLAANKGVRVIPENYGVAILDNAIEEKDRFVIIPWHLVWVRVFEGIKNKDGVVLERSLVARNAGKMPRILRNGHVVKVSSGTYRDKGAWRITSIKNQKSGIKVNLGQPDTVNTEKEVLDPATGKLTRKVRPDCRHEASLSSIVRGNLQILSLPLTGFSIQPLGTEK